MIIELFKSSRLTAGNDILCTDPVCTESWILEKVLRFALQFSRPGKSLENRDKVEQKDKKFFSSYNKCFTSPLQVKFFPVGQIIFNLACTFAAYHW